MWLKIAFDALKILVENAYIVLKIKQATHNALKPSVQINTLVNKYMFKNREEVIKETII